jgi:hypothetical protein
VQAWAQVLNDAEHSQSQNAMQKALQSAATYLPDNGSTQVAQPSDSAVRPPASPPLMQSCGVGTNCQTIVAVIGAFVCAALAAAVAYCVAKIRKDQHEDPSSSQAAPDSSSNTGSHVPPDHAHSKIVNSHTTNSGKIWNLCTIIGNLGSADFATENH